MAAAVAADTEAVVTEVAAEVAMEVVVMEAVAAAAREVADMEAAVAAAEKVNFIVHYYVVQYFLCMLSGNLLVKEPLSSYFARTLLLCSMNMDKISNSCTIIK